MDRIAYFQESIPEDSSAVSDEDLREMVTRYVGLEARPCSGHLLTRCSSHRYINRDVPEIEQLQHERRKGRPPAKREEVLLQRTETENKELKTGFWLPDVTQEDVVAALRRWNGDWSSLSTMKFIRITADGGKQASAFPPKGLS